jgi:SAM-dependent methyltransferase
VYDERADFEHHKTEVDTAIRLARELRLPLTGKSLDLGAGHGMHLGFLAPHFSRVYCADIIQYTALYGGEFPKLLAEKYRRHGVDLPLDRLAMVEADGMDMLFRDNTFDWCFTFNTFEHIPDPGRALNEIVRVLKPGGIAYITFDPVWTADTGGHFHHFVPQPWAHLVLSTEEYQRAMRANGAPPEDVELFVTGLNRWRPKQFFDAFERLGSEVEILFHDKYEGLADADHFTHKNKATALRLGYSESELLLRNLRWAIRKCPASK